MDDRTAAQEELLRTARARGTGATLATYTKLSGPGWLQSAITLGGGSLASALYLGVLTGFHLLWLQPLAMLLGIVMLSAIGYVTLSTGERPFAAINQHVSPVLGWGWLLAVLVANLVWSLPQFALGTAAIQQNLVPSLAGTPGKIVSCSAILGIATVVIWFYDKGTRGLAIFEGVLKGMVGLVVLCFFGVVLTLTFSADGLAWGEVFQGLVPDFGLLSRPSPELAPIVAGTGAFADWWSARIVSEQQDVVIAAFATAVGINMTFLLPYSMLKKGWNAHFRGLAIFDLATGLLIPFVLATGCVVIAAASQFHASFDERLLDDAEVAATQPAFLKRLDARLAAEHEGEDYASRSVAPALASELGEAAFQERVAATLDELPQDDRRLAAMLLRRDAWSLANALEPLTGNVVAQYVFGIGVLGMAISTVIILMLISGFAFCEMFGVPPTGWPHRIGCLAAGVVGFFGPFVWTGQAKFWLAVPTSNFGMVLLPIAYWTFFLLINSKGLLGVHRPSGAKRLVWNIAMILAAGVATFASLWTVDKNLGWIGHGAMLAFLAVAAAERLRRRARS